MSYLSLDQLWHLHDQFDFTPQEEKLCIYAQNLTAWIEENCQHALKSYNVITIHQATLLLVHQYFNYKAALPKAHRHHYSERGHICVFQVFERTFHLLNAQLLRINPPLLVEPPTTVQQLVHVDAVNMGEFFKR